MAMNNYQWQAPRSMEYGFGGIACHNIMHVTNYYFVDKMDCSLGGIASIPLATVILGTIKNATW